MFLIKTEDKKQYWTEEYEIESDFVKFSTKSRTGRVFPMILNKKYIVSITEIELKSEGKKSK